MEKLTALRVFRRVVEKRSFSRAARDLGLSNAAASKNVRELEAELGVPLLVRTTRRVSLTPAGERYYAQAAAILDQLAEADATVKDLAASPRGLIRVSAPMSLGLTTLMPALTEFLRAYPELRIELELADRKVDPIEEGFDLCIRGSGALPDSTLVAMRLASIERALVASPDYLAKHGAPRSPADVARHECLLYSLASARATWTFVKGTVKETVAVAGRLEINSGLALAQAATAGMGLAFVPVATVTQELSDGRLVRLLPEWRGAAQALYAVYPRHRERTKSLRLLVEHLAKSLQTRRRATTELTP